MKTSLDSERAEGEGGGNKKISFSVDSLLGSRTDHQEITSNDADSTAADQSLGETDDSDVDIEDVDSNPGDPGDGDDENEGRHGVVIPQPLLPRLYQGHAPPPAWPFGAFPWMAPNHMFRGGSPNSMY